MSPENQDPEGFDQDRFGRTLTIVGVLLCLGFGVVFARVAQLQTDPGDALRVHVDDRTSRRLQEGRRGDILDRRGRPLASSVLGQRLFVDPAALKPPYGELFQDIARITGDPVDSIAQRIVARVERNDARAQQGRPPIRYVSVGPILTDAQLEAARRLDHPAVHIENRPVRRVLSDDSLAPIVGLVGADNTGLAGIERMHERALDSSPGYLDYIRDAQGRAMWVEASGYLPARSGENVFLTIDEVIQQIALEELERGVERADAAGGRVIIVDPSNGEILAMGDTERAVEGLLEPPSRDGAPVQLDPGARYRTINSGEGEAISPALARNRCVEDVYEPGSTFKPFMWAVVTEAGRADPNEVLDTHDGVWRTPFGRRIEDVIQLDEMSWAEVLVNSSNIGMVQGVSRVSFDELRQAVLRFGFGSRTRIGLPGESPGIVTPRGRWGDYTQSSLASGYEIAVTPLQMVRAFSCFARQGDDAGTLPTLELTASMERSAPSPFKERVLQHWIAVLTREQMVHVAERMNSRILDVYPEEPVLDYTFFGKSGTAEIPRPDGRGYFDNQYNSSFIAGAPFRSPRIVVLVVIDDPGPHTKRVRQHYGSWVAGPVVRRITQRTLEYMGVPGDRRAAIADADEG